MAVALSESARLYVCHTVQHCQSTVRLQVLFRKMADERSTSIAAIMKAADEYIALAHTTLLRSQLAKGDLRPYGAVAHLENVLGIANEADIEADGMVDGLDGIGGIVPGGFGVGESYSASLVERAYL